MTWTEDLDAGVAQLLAARGVGTFDPDADVAQGATGVIVLGGLSDEATSGVGIQSYRLGPDDPAAPVARVIVQLWARAATRAEVNQLDQAGYDALQGLADVWFGSCHVTQSVQKSSLPMGVDARLGYERSSNYTFDLDLPATSNRSY